MLKYSYDPNEGACRCPKKSLFFKTGEEINGFHNYFCDWEIQLSIRNVFAIIYFTNNISYHYHDR